jgi:two-component system alkaline phosphatase synthesis response regulator PhoP
MIGHILLIEDNDLLGASLIDNLQMENFTVDWVQDGETGLKAAMKGVHDLIILDLSLPKLDGFEVLSEIRKKHFTPVLILSARDAVHDKIHGLELKADDYLTKPFHFKELLLRVQALLRRSQPPQKDFKKIKIGNATFDFGAQQVEVNGVIEKLTDKETRVLKLLLTYTNQVVAREKILDLVWGYNNYPSTRTIDNMIVKFRKWIEKDPAHPEIITSHRGIGYSLMLKEETHV